MAKLSRRAVLLAAFAAPAVARADTLGDQLARAARAQIGITTGYDPAYFRLPYPGGDPPRDTGVCADVVVRAARDAWEADLQKLVHEDMRRAWATYPSRRAWGLHRPDANIDHRRVLNLEVYWTRQGARLWRAPPGARGDAWPHALEPGDLLTWLVDARLPHVGVVAPDGRRVVQNIGLGTRYGELENFFPHVAVAHYRWRPA